MVNVPQKFGGGIIIPLAKDKDGDLSCSTNYRGITLKAQILRSYLKCVFLNYIAVICIRLTYSLDLRRKQVVIVQFIQ